MILKEYIDFLDSLDLSNLQLTSLPKSFRNITVGGNLNLFSNRLQELPESFGNIEIGGDF